MATYVAAMAAAFASFPRALPGWMLYPVNVTVTLNAVKHSASIDPSSVPSTVKQKVDFRTPSGNPSIPCPVSSSGVNTTSRSGRGISGWSTR